MNVIPYLRVISVLVIGLILKSFTFAQLKVDTSHYPDPERFRADIDKFLIEDQAHPAKPGSVLCVGSSSMRMWHPTIEQDLAPLTLIRRGFGGSNMNDVLYYFDQIVLPYKPRAILLYEGDNDQVENNRPMEILDSFRIFVDRVHEVLPECRIYVVSPKPAIARLNLLGTLKILNQLLEAYCLTDDLLTFVDVCSPMLLEDGTPNPALFIEDDLHMTREGYGIWTRVVRPIVVEPEKVFE